MQHSPDQVTGARHEWFAFLLFNRCIAVHPRGRNRVFLRAYALSSIGVDFRVTQVVDGTLGVHGMIPKKLFLRQPDTYWYRSF